MWELNPLFHQLEFVCYKIMLSLLREMSWNDQLLQLVNRFYIMGISVLSMIYVYIWLALWLISQRHNGMSDYLPFGLNDSIDTFRVVCSQMDIQSLLCPHFIVSNLHIILKHKKMDVRWLLASRRLQQHWRSSFCILTEYITSRNKSMTRWSPHQKCDMHG